MYTRMGEHLQAEFDRIRFVLSALIEESTDAEQSQVTSQFVGTQNDREEPAAGLQSVGRMVRSLAGADSDKKNAERSSSRDRFYSVIEGRAEEIERELEETRGSGVDLPLDQLTRAFALSRTEIDALLLVLAPELDRSVYQLYGQVENSSQAKRPTVGFIERILADMGHGRTDGPTRTSPIEALSPTSPLFEYQLLERYASDESNPPSHDRLVVDERIVQFLKGDDSLDDELRGLVTVEQADRSLSDLVFDEETTETVRAIDGRTSETAAPTVVYLSGEDGTGKERLPAALAADDTPILRAAAEDVLTDGDRLTRLLREAALRDAAIHLEAVEEVTEDEDGPIIDAEGPEDGGFAIEEDRDSLGVDDVVERLDVAPGDVFLGHTESWTPDVDLSRHRLEICECPFPEQAVRRRIWAEYTDEFADDELVSHIATNFRLPQRDIRRAIRTARYLCRTGVDAEDIDDAALPAHDVDDDAFAPVDGDLTRDHLYEACKRYSASNLETLAEPIDPGYTWDDIALNDRQESHLRELCGHLQYRGAVTSEWGFGEPGSRGDGVIALFYGQPGTGKTMAAEIIANETGLDLYRVDLSQIINKYVGETESRLATLLDEAERSNAILLFDEADSIFGTRAEVKEATDRYANTEINFLLQRLESFDGILLLTTNQRSGIDSAFKRRIQHSIAFEKPQELIRREFWMEVFPEEANVATDGFDYEFLGRITTTPALIRKVAKYAAYIAATEAHDGRPLDTETADLDDVTITFDHVLRALQYAREAGGAGFQVNFGEYEDHLREYETHGVERDWEEELDRLRETDDDRDQTTVSDSGVPATTEKRSADQVDPGDDRSPEAVVREFFARLADADDRAHDLYHSDALADEFSHRSLQLMEHGDLSIESELTRLRNDHDRVVLEFDQRLDGTHIPDDIDGKPLPVRYELRPEPDGWRIFDISRVEETRPTR